ncbi:MAG TPA: hypothetical protein VNC78_11870 [Actinomycetota bacterium]|nr:hypothetical protein [Actinomycetota bacterium]
MKKTTVLAITFLMLVLGACADDPKPDSAKQSTAPRGKESFNQSFAGAKAYPVLASSEVVVGPNRFLVGLLNDEDAPIGSPDIKVYLSFFELDSDTERAAFVAGTEFIETLPGGRGLYVAQAEFTSAGTWGLEAHIVGEGIDETLRASFDVLKSSKTPAISAPAPRSKTPTSDDDKLRNISSDPHPDPRFYEMSIDEAVTSGRPSVIVFATPKFCTSQVCGPTLETVKRESRTYKGVNFLHVEVYSNLDDPSNLKLVPTVKQWGLPSEPWVFVVDANGKVAAKFEGTVSAEELAAALKRLR